MLHARFMANNVPGEKRAQPESHKATTIYKLLFGGKVRKLKRRVQTLKQKDTAESVRQRCCGSTRK